MALGEAFQAAVRELPDNAQSEVARELIAGPLLERQDLASVTRLACWQPREGDREERERREDIQDPDQEPHATLLTLPAPPEFVELVGLGHASLTGRASISAAERLASSW